uniref:Zinc metalloproteinase n=1 Tax=Parascaris univalens TaxID=6257 RepID=A0A915C7J2_PARUN
MTILRHERTVLSPKNTDRENERYTSGTFADDVIFERKDPNSKPHHDELSVNDPDEYFQGDVDLSEKQAEILSETLQDSNDSARKEKNIEPKTRKKRKIGREPLYVRWDTTKPISYEFADSIPQSTRHKIREAIALWELRTCVRFLENGPSVDRIEFFDGGGCSSFVGKTGGTQGISISTPGCDVVGIISHEIGHALGIFHEQARPDQNRNIFVNYNNIPISRWNNFHPVSQNQADTYNLPYDTGSVMHYGAYGFATDPYVPTITTRDKFQQYTIGQREGPSFLDFAAVNIAYHCIERCPYMHCEHDGYPNPNDCTECLCPDGFAGRMCQFVHYTSCGALIAASTNPVFISSPGYPVQFPVGTQCVWLLKAPVGCKVMLQFVDTFQMQCEDTCDKSYVELKNSGDFRLTGYRFCCSKKPTQIFESVTNEMVLIFRARGDTGRGFKAKVWSNLDAAVLIAILESTMTLPEERQNAERIMTKRGEANSTNYNA